MDSAGFLTVPVAPGRSGPLRRFWSGACVHLSGLAVGSACLNGQSLGADKTQKPKRGDNYLVEEEVHLLYSSPHAENPETDSLETAVLPAV
jgi:hypothetical protein